LRGANPGRGKRGVIKPGYGAGSSPELIGGASRGAGEVEEGKVGKTGLDLHIQVKYR